MKILTQSPQLLDKFQQQIQHKVSARREEIAEMLGGGWLGSFAVAIGEIKQLKNQAKGFIGETVVNFLF